MKKLFTVCIIAFLFTACDTDNDLPVESQIWKLDQQFIIGSDTVNVFDNTTTDLNWLQLNQDEVAITRIREDESNVTYQQRIPIREEIFIDFDKDFLIGRLTIDEGRTFTIESGKEQLKLFCRLDRQLAILMVYIKK